MSVTATSDEKECWRNLQFMLLRAVRQPAITKTKQKFMQNGHFFSLRNSFSFHIFCWNSKGNLIRFLSSSIRHIYEHVHGTPSPFFDITVFPFMLFRPPCSSVCHSIICIVLMFHVNFDGFCATTVELRYNILCIKIFDYRALNEMTHTKR